MTNFRLIHRDIVDRICEYRGRSYIPGLVVLYSSNPINVEVEHMSRQWKNQTTASENF